MSVRAGSSRHPKPQDADYIPDVRRRTASLVLRQTPRRRVLPQPRVGIGAGRVERRRQTLRTELCMIEGVVHLRAETTVRTRSHTGSSFTSEIFQFSIPGPAPGSSTCPPTCPSPAAQRPSDSDPSNSLCPLCSRWGFPVTTMRAGTLGEPVMLVGGPGSRHRGTDSREDSAFSDARSKIPWLVNILEKPNDPKFSISSSYLLCRVPDYAE